LFKGVITAMVTPFDDKGNPDEKAIRELCRFELSKKVNAIFALGTTAEGLSQSVKQRKRVLEIVLDEIQYKIPVIVHVGSINIEEVEILAKHAVDKGADAITSITPYYYSVSDQEIIDYYIELSKMVPEHYPVYIYNFPGITNNDVTPEVLSELLSKCSNIKGIKFSSADMIRLQEYIRFKEYGFNVLSGCDPLFYTLLTLGCDGLVSGNSNVFPEIFTTVYKYYQEGEFEKARRLQLIAAKVAKLLEDGNPAVIKGAMKFAGIEGGYVRKPYKDVSDDKILRLTEGFKQIKCEFEEALK